MELDMTSTNKLCAVAAALVGAAIVTAPVSAQARCIGDNCKRPISSTKVNTSYNYNTVRKVQNVTRYRDIDRPRHVTNVNRVVNVTRIQPINRVNTVTRVHNRTAILNETQRASRTAMLPAQSSTTAKTVNLGGHIPAPKVNTTYRYNTVQKVNNVTRYNDVNRTRYVKNIHRIVNVTRVQPMIHTNVVTRIHDRPVVTSKTVNLSETRTLPARTISTGKTIHINHAPSSSNGHRRLGSAASLQD
jgi:hypothetical protein